jgi:hypothetical protein
VILRALLPCHRNFEVFKSLVAASSAKSINCGARKTLENMVLQTVDFGEEKQPCALSDASFRVKRGGV